jgi:hypothetical protein
MSRNQEAAFPVQGLPFNTGMTMRDYFAARAMQGYFASYRTPIESMENIARSAYRMAEYMMKERKNWNVECPPPIV